MRPGGPDLLSVHHETVALQLGAGRKASKVGARARLGIALRPDDAAFDDRRQVLRLLRLGCELHENGADVIEALGGQLWCTYMRQLLRHDDLLVQGRAHAAVLLRPVRGDPAPPGRACDTRASVPRAAAASCGCAADVEDWPRARSGLRCGTRLPRACHDGTWRWTFAPDAGDRDCAPAASFFIKFIRSGPVWSIGRARKRPGYASRSPVRDNRRQRQALT